MNYRHAFHAGNFADVVKHAVLVRMLLHLRTKESAFRVIDTHAGIGIYDLTGDEATRTSEWRTGIGRLLEKPPAGEASELLKPYLDLVIAENPGGKPTRYPGSPSIARTLCRQQDRMIFCELQPDDYAALKHNVGRDPRAKAIEIDGWTALKAYLPPKERRGLVLIDPPFEQPNEFDRFADGFAEAHRRWQSGTYLLWYPIKNQNDVHVFENRMARMGITKLLRIEFAMSTPRANESLGACGLMVANPPWTLENELKILLPALIECLAPKGKGHHCLDWLAR